jgi:hypothetical protein
VGGAEDGDGILDPGVGREIGCGRQFLLRSRKLSLKL